MAAPLSTKGYVGAVTNSRGYHVGLETHIATGVQYMGFIQERLRLARSWRLPRSNPSSTSGAASLASRSEACS